MSAPITRIVMSASARRTFRLVKNLNVAPSAYGFEPHIQFVVHFFLNNVLADRRDHLRVGYRWNRLKLLLLGSRYEHIVVVLADLIVSRPNQLTEFHVEEFLNSNASPDRIS